MLLQTIQFIYHLFIYLLTYLFPLFFFLFWDYLFAHVVPKVFDLNVLKVFEYLKMCICIEQIFDQIQQGTNK